MIQRRTILLATGTLVIAGCSTSSSGTSDPAAKRREIDASVDNALAQLYGKVQGSRELGDKARGILVMPKVVSAGFVIGGSYGQGALRKHGVTAAYYSVGAGSVGLLAGAESKSMYMMFMTDDALKNFQQSKGWTAGVDGSIAVATIGANGQLDTNTAKAPIIGFVLTNAGLMGNLSLEGTKISKLDI